MVPGVLIRRIPVKVQLSPKDRVYNRRSDSALSWLFKILTSLSP
jgi:hypothetical protein